MNDDDKIKLIHAAADWWLGNPILGGSSARNSQERDFGMDMFELMRAKSALEDKRNTDPEAVQNSKTAFKKNLVELVLNDIGVKKLGREMNLSTDWGPEMELAQAVQASGVDCRNFPNMSNTWINFQEGTVTARCGIHSDFVLVYKLNS